MSIAMCYHSSMKAIYLRISEELKEALAAYAQEEQRSLNNFIVKVLVTEHLRREK
jgi:predicted HicB family RNase H-like nuclease